MDRARAETTRRFGRFPDARTLRLASGLILALFLLTHVSNVAFGLASAAAMDDAWPWLTGLWSNPVGTILLYGALAVHFGLTLQVIYRRRTLRMSGREAVQAAFGLALPFLLVPHVVSTEVVPAMNLTAVGDGINVASRLESAAKAADVGAVVSADLMVRAGLDPAFGDAVAREALAIRGRSRSLDVFLVPDALAFAALAAGA